MKKFFSHDNLINSIYKYFPSYLTDILEKKYDFKGKITIEKLSEPYAAGFGDNKLKISENAIIVSGQIAVKLTYMENAASQELTIKVEERSIGSIKRKKGAKLMKTLGRAVVDEVVKVGVG